MEDLKQLQAVAVAAARAGGAVLAELFGSHDLEVREKAKNDFVTRADHESEDAVVETIRRAYPEHEVLGEERGLDRAAASEYRWLVDPLDGTTNFLQGLPVFAVSVACQHRGRSVAAAVFEPLAGSLFAASEAGGASLDGRPIYVSERAGLADAFLATGYPFRTRTVLDTYLEVFRDVFGQARAVRRCGSAALDLAHTASGIFDGFFEFRLSPWDIAAGELLVREAGGVITDLDGGDGFYAAGNLVCGAPGVHSELLATVRRHVDEAAFAALLESPVAGPLL